MSSGQGSTTTDRTPPRLLLPFFRQFGHPRGLLGRLALAAMVRGNRALNQWVVAVAGAGPGDALIDVGCGPGLALEVAAATGARVAGVDVSEMAVAMARRRCGGARVEVAPAGALPFADDELTVATSVNSVGHWPDPEAGVREVHRVLATGGRFALALRLYEPGAKPTDRRAYGARPGQLDKLDRLLRHVGFVEVERHEGAPAGERHVVLLARKPA